MKIYGLFYILILSALGVLSACNSMNFSNAPTTTDQCSVSKPCLKASGLYHVAQDLVFTRTNRADILVIDDNSGSMEIEQENLGSPFNGFIDQLNAKGIDWQIAVTNTDVCPIAGGICDTPTGVIGARGRFVGPKTSSVQPNYGSYILNKTTPDVTNLFYSIIQRGDEVGAGDERGIYAANLAIDLRDTSNAGFFRDNSNLALVFLSDEDERSVGGLSMSDPAYAVLENYDLPQTLLNKVTDTWHGQKNLMANAIIIKPNDSVCLDTQKKQGPYNTAHYGTVYAQLAALAQNGSVVGSICDNGAGSFAKMLSNIAGAIKDLPESNVMTLNYVPNTPPTVTFSPASSAVGYTWTPGTSKISFAVRPAPNTTVHVEYDYISN